MIAKGCFRTWLTSGRNRCPKVIKMHPSNPANCLDTTTESWEENHGRSSWRAKTYQTRSPNPTPRLQLLPGKGMSPWQMGLGGSENGKKTVQNGHRNQRSWDCADSQKATACRIHLAEIRKMIFTALEIDHKQLDDLRSP